MSSTPTSTHLGVRDQVFASPAEAVHGVFAGVEGNAIGIRPARRMQVLGDGPFGWIAEQVRPDRNTRRPPRCCHWCTDHPRRPRTGCATGNVIRLVALVDRSDRPNCRRSGCSVVRPGPFTAKQPGGAHPLEQAAARLVDRPHGHPWLAGTASWRCSVAKVTLSGETPSTSRTVRVALYSWCRVPPWITLGQASPVNQMRSMA